MKLRLLSAFAAILVSVGPALAQPAGPVTDRTEAAAILQEYEGSWTARGMSRTRLQDDMETASCRMETIYDPSAGTLTNAGRCAVAMRAVPIDGAVMLQTGGALTGAFFGTLEEAELLSSSGQVHQGGISVEASYRADIRGTVQDIDVRVSAGRPAELRNGDTAFLMRVEVRDPETMDYVTFSEFTFTQRSGG